MLNLKCLLDSPFMTDKQIATIQRAWRLFLFAPLLRRFSYLCLFKFCLLLERSALAHQVMEESIQ